MNQLFKTLLNEEVNIFTENLNSSCIGNTNHDKNKSVDHRTKPYFSGGFIKGCPVNNRQAGKRSTISGRTTIG